MRKYLHAACSRASTASDTRSPEGLGIAARTNDHNHNTVCCCDTFCARGTDRNIVSCAINRIASRIIASPSSWAASELLMSHLSTWVVLAMIA